MSEKTYILLQFVFFVILTAILVCVAAQRDALKEQAVRRGYAEWVVKSHWRTSWKWKEEAK